MITYENCPVCQNINGAGAADCPGHDGEPTECKCDSCLEVLANDGLLGDDEPEYDECGLCQDPSPGQLAHPHTPPMPDHCPPEPNCPNCQRMLAEELAEYQAYENAYQCPHGNGYECGDHFCIAMFA